MSDTVLGWLFGGWSFGSQSNDPAGLETRRVSPRPHASLDVSLAHTSGRVHDTAHEARLMADVQQGKSEALDQIFTMYYTELKGYATSLLHDDDAAEDVLQDLFVQLWHSRARGFRVEEPLAPYLYRAVRYRILNARRGHQRAAHVAERLRDVLGMDDPRPALGTARLESTELVRLILEAINRLPPRCQEIFTLSRLRGLTHQQIAALLGITTSTVNTQLGRALRVIRAVVHDYGEGVTPK